MADPVLGESTDSTSGAPPEFICPISLGIMNDPVIGSDGSTYERSEIIKWLREHHDSPKTRTPMFEDSLVPNIALKQSIQRWRELNHLGPVTIEVIPNSEPEPKVKKAKRVKSSHKHSEFECKGCCYRCCCKGCCCCCNPNRPGGKACLIVSLVVVLLLGGWAVLAAVVLILFVLFLATCGFCCLCCGLCATEEFLQCFAEGCCCCCLCDEL